MTQAARRAAALTFALAALALAGCTASTPDGGQTSAPPPAPSDTPPSTSAAPSSTAVTSTAAAPKTSTAPATTTSRTSAAPHPVKSVAPRSTCTKVSIRVIRGSAAQGIEFAALQFTNDASRTCRLYGYPAATLSLAGKTIGRPARPATKTASQFTLTPGATAESRLTDYTNCQAPLSDQVHVVVPGSTIHAVRPAQLRACILHVGRLGEPE